MTCIVGVGNGKCMVIGADSSATSDDDDTLYIRNDFKVFTIKQTNGPDAIIGSYDSFRKGQILMDLVLPEDKSRSGDKDGNYRFLRKEVVPVIRKLFAEAGFIEIKDGVESGGGFIIGYRNWIYEFESDFSVASYSNEYATLGSGASFARGVLDYIFKYTDYKHLDLSQEGMIEIVNRALDISERNTKNVRGPMRIITLPLKKFLGSKSAKRTK